MPSHKCSCRLWKMAIEVEAVRPRLILFLWRYARIDG